MTANDSTKKNLLLLLALCAFMVGLDSLVVSPLIPSIASNVQFKLDLGGLLVTAYALVYGISAPFFGPLSDRWGRKNMILIGMLIFAVGTALTGIGTNLNMLLVFRAITGLGGAMIMPSVFALIGDTFSYEQRGKAMGMIMGAMVGSTVLGVPIGAFLAHFGSWRAVFWIIGLFSLLVFFAVLGGIPKTPPMRNIPVSPAKAYLGQFRTAFSNSSIFFALLSTFLWTAGLQGMFAYVGIYYKQNFNLDVSMIGLIILAAGLGSVFGNIIGGRLADKVGKKIIIAIAAVIAAIGVLGFSTLTHMLVGAIVVHVIWSTAIGLGQSSQTALISELSPKVRGTVMSLNSSAMYIGMMVATATSASLLQSGGFLKIGIMCAIASLLVMPVTSFFIKETTSAASAEANTAKS